ncbi:tail fiber domain-containing protein [Emticicia agri]|uniref:Peptidase S74 domain-containing protein n=1 Tax=Emticicia agri TaxID=2492393 RepID=A0A4Q5M1E0_9BACT|nr:tail fiber domain-containing protein [Emticicia agri]RYU96018.1 hypothetical protein EWM59_08965 [Emticicia agri]
MKKSIFSLIFCSLYTLSFGQIYINNSSNESITITPSGLTGKLPNVTTKNDLIALGPGALHNVTDDNYESVAIGNMALHNTTDNRNTAFGSLALYSTSTGSFNSAFGNHTLVYNTSGYGNVAFGSFALRNNETLKENVAIGVSALFSQGAYNNNNGSNIGVGYFSLYAVKTLGKYNVGVGAYVLQNTSIGSYNVAVGYQAGLNNQTGSNNIAIGNYTSTAVFQGSNNISLGNKALKDVGSANYNIGIGYNAGAFSSNSGMLYVANTNTPSPLLGGISTVTHMKVGINRNINLTGGNNFLSRSETLQVEGEAFKTSAGGTWVIPSDRRLKKNITALNSEEILTKVLQMKGVTYEMKDESQKGIQYGFIAQEIRAVFPDKISENVDGYLSADYGSYTAIEIESIKALHEKIVELEKYNTVLKERIEKLRTAKELISQKIDGIESKK